MTTMSQPIEEQLVTTHEGHTVWISPHPNPKQPWAHLTVRDPVGHVVHSEMVPYDPAVRGPRADTWLATLERVQSKITQIRLRRPLA